MPRSDPLKIYNCGKHCEKRKNCLLQAIFPFLTLFSTLYDTIFLFQILIFHFKMSSAICFNFDKSKFFSSSNAISLLVLSIRRCIKLPLPKFFSYTFVLYGKRLNGQCFYSRVYKEMQLCLLFTTNPLFTYSCHTIL